MTAAVSNDRDLFGELVAATELVRARTAERDALSNEVRRTEGRRDLAAVRLLGIDSAVFAYTNHRACTDSPTQLCLYLSPDVDECVVCRRAFEAGE